MARATTKAELLQAGNAQFSKLWEIIDSLSPEAQRGTFDFEGKEAHWARDKNLRDILVHLYEWHQLLLNWVASNQAGEARPFLGAPYNWKTYGEMNVLFWQEHQGTSYEASIEMLKKSHGAVVQLIETFSDEALFSKGALPWTGGSTLGQYCVSVTASHYDWAIKKIKKYKKELGE